MMRRLAVRSTGLALLPLALLAGCSKLGLGGKPTAPEVPTARQLKYIRYMSQAPGPNGRPLYDHLSQARTCYDFEIALRWDRPPNVRGGPFNDRMTYVSARMPADLPKNSEVFVSGVIEQGQSLPSGGSVWAVRLKDGSEVQAVETAQYAQKQEEAQEDGGEVTMRHPYTPGRILCAYGFYQGDTGTALNGHGHVPLVSLLFAMDRTG
jgi:hypothetical protein